MIVLPNSYRLTTGNNGCLRFVEIDGGDVYLLVDLCTKIPATARIVRGHIVGLEGSPPSGYDGTYVEIQLTDGTPGAENLYGTVRLADGRQVGHAITMVDPQLGLHSRLRGLFETEVLAQKAVLVIGLGSGGSSVAVELAKAGVRNFALVDHDRLEVHNVLRHACGISDLGRLKTNAVRDIILDKNPDANVTTVNRQCDWTWHHEMLELVHRADLVFCCTDNRPSRLMINALCVRDSKPCIYGGAFRRAYGGQVLRVTPHTSLCYQCFIDLMPEMAENQEIASASAAVRIAYSDMPVAVEPGMSTDIAPISLMCAKLGILELLRGSETTLSPLYDDLTSSWYMWLNRREKGTQWEALPALDSGDADFRIMAWYGVRAERNKACPTCGEFYMYADPAGRLTPSSAEVAAFGPALAVE